MNNLTLNGKNVPIRIRILFALLLVPYSVLAVWVFLFGGTAELVYTPKINLVGLRKE